MQADAYAAENNASAISFAGSRFSFGAGYGMWSPDFADSRIFALGGYAKIGSKFGLGLFGRKLSDTRNLVVTNENSVVTGSFTPSDLLAGLGASYAITDFLSVGVCAKYLSSSLAPDYNYSGIFAVLSATYARNALRAGIAVSDLPSALMIKAGASYTIAGLTPAVEVDIPSGGGISASGSLEYGIVDIVFLRAGYHYGSQGAALPSYASLGLGVKFAGFALDAAYLLASDTLGGSLMAGLSYSF